MEQLFVGAIVHYVYNLGFGETNLICVPAIVHTIYHKESGNIAVREFQTMDLKSCQYSETHERGGTWHWPERT